MLPSVFSSHMVLQRDAALPVWGSAEPGEEVTVELGETVESTRADAAGKWSVDLPARPASSVPTTLTVSGRDANDRIVLDDILIGDVWICSGQSNMQWPLSKTESADEAIASADLPNLRLMRLEGVAHPSGVKWPADLLERLTPEHYYTVHRWTPATPTAAGDFSGVGFFFGRQLLETLDVPIGLIQNAVGGSPTEAWISREVLAKDADLRPMLDDWLACEVNDSWVRERGRQNLSLWFERCAQDPQSAGDRPGHPFMPGFLFDAGIRPIAPFAIRGVIWYQGESNASNPPQHEKLFEMLVADWRDRWSGSDLPFGFVQLAALNRPTWPEFREGQRQLEKRIPATGMATAIDIGHPTNVHPQNKRDVGDRLARWALAEVYKRPDVVASGPTVADVTRSGMRLIVQFENTAGRLMTTDGHPATGFEVAGTDGVFHRAEATIDGDTLEVASSRVVAPVAVRYAWAPYPQINHLRNAGGLPASPFIERTEAAIAEIETPIFIERFDDAADGVFTELSTDAGTWTAPANAAEIDPAHAYSGRKCLHLLGAADAWVVFTPSEPLPGQVELAFQAERWTSRSPFQFKIEVMRDGAWSELLDGDRAVVVGRAFKSLVRIPIDKPGVEKIRLRCEAPHGTGILIDDFRVLRPQPMKFASAAVDQLTTPLLVRAPCGSVARLRITTTGQADPITVRSVTIGTDGTTRPEDVERVELYYTGGTGNPSVWRSSPDNLFAAGNQFGESQVMAATLKFESEQELQAGDNYFWISYTLRETADLDGRVDASVKQFTLDDGREITPQTPSPAGTKRLGVALRQGGDDGSVAYRIPGLSTTTRGTLIAVYDIRRDNGTDLPGNIDVGMSRSTDGGRTWEPMKVVLDMGDDPKWRGEGVGDPTVMVDRRNDTIWVAGAWSHGNRAWHGSGPGMTPEETGQYMLTRSGDDGRTWSDPINITEQVKRPEWRLLIQGPGRGITMSDGTIVFPSQFKDASNVPHSTVIISEDGGRTWRIGGGVKSNTNESQVVELDDGRLMINCRDLRGGRRSVATSTDKGRTWTEHSTSRLSLVEPVCMASLLNVDRDLGRENTGRLLFSNPAVASAPRRSMTIKGSPDDGKTWTTRLLIDEGSSAGYSCLTMIDEQTIGILYEGSRGRMTFQRIPLKELFPKTK